MTHPQILVTVDGVPVSGAFFDRLASLTITDREGIQSDTLDLIFNDAVPHFQPPRHGALVEVTISGGFVGAYIIDRVEFACLPYSITVRGHSADLRSDMKANKTKHWDDASVKDIVEEKAGDYGLQSKISDAVSGHIYEWIGQQDESDLNFLERLAQRHGALFTIKNGTLLWLERGTGKKADGTAIPSAQVFVPSIIIGSCRVSETDVDRFAKVKAYWQDRKSAKRQEVIVDADPEASGEHVLRDPYGSKEEATAAAQAAAREMMRGLIETGCSIIGRPALMAGQPIIYSHVEFIAGAAEFGQPLECLSSSGRDGGVRSRVMVLKPTNWDLVQLAIDADGPAEFIRARIGARYDYTGLLLSHVLAFGRHDEERWFCSEIIAAALARRIPRPAPTRCARPSRLPAPHEP